MHYFFTSISAGTTTTTAVSTLDNLSFFQICFGNLAVRGAYTSQTRQMQVVFWACSLFCAQAMQQSFSYPFYTIINATSKSHLFPHGNKVSIGNFIINTEIIDFSRNLALLVRFPNISSAQLKKTLVM